MQPYIFGTGIPSMSSQLVFTTLGQDLVITGLERNSKISIYSVVGTGIVLNDRISGKAVSYTLTPGFYLVSVWSESGKVSKKVLIK